MTCVCTCIQTLSPLLCQLVLIEGVQRTSPRWPRHILLSVCYIFNERLICDMCLYNHTDSPSSVVSASSNRRGAKNEPKVAKTHSSVGMLHLLTKDYVTCACTDAASSNKYKTMLRGCMLYTCMHACVLKIIFFHADVSRKS